MENQCHFVSSRGLLKTCDFHSDYPRSSCSNDTLYLFDMIESTKMHNGMSIYICNDILPFFIITILPQISNTFVLVSGDSDTTVPDEIINKSQYNSLTQHPLLIKWFIQNTIIQDCDKIVQLPIGLDYHTISNNPTHHWKMENEGHLPKCQEDILLEIKHTALPFQERSMQIYVNMSTQNDRFNQRGPALQQIHQPLMSLNQIFTPRTENWRNISQFAFALSPYGNGMDCHRTWEILCLGAIPIVCAPHFRQLFQDLPILNVNSWSEITEELLHDTIRNFSTNIQRFNYDKLTMDYWRNLIANYKII